MTSYAYDTARGQATVNRRWDSYDTDQFRVVRIVPGAAPDETDHGAGKHRPEEPPSPWWAGTGANAAMAVVLTVLAVATAGLYWLACELTGHPAPWRVLLIVVATVLGVGAVGAVLHGWTQRVLTAKVDRHAATLEQISGRKAAILEQIAARMGRLEGIVAEEMALLRRRVEAAEEKADAAIEAAEFARQRSWWLGYAQGARDQLGGGTNGNVVRLPTS